MSQQCGLDIEAALSKVVSPEQRGRLDTFPEPLRTRLYERIRSSLLASVRIQVDYCTSVGIHPVALDRLIRTETEQWEQEQIHQQRLRAWVQAGASYVMLNTLHGVSRREFDAIRKELGLTGTSGRKSVSDAESADIYRQWESLGKPQNLDGLTALHHLNQQPLYVLWGLVHDWTQVQMQLSRQRQRGRW